MDLWSHEMRAVQYLERGGADVLRVVDKPVGEPGLDEVRVRIVRSGVNPTDWKARSGATATGPVERPQVPNQDGAGVVDAVGEGVDPDLLGRRVWVWEAAHGRPEGTAQEYALIPRRRVVELPDSASFELGASLGVPFLTAHRCLTVAEHGPSRLGPGTLTGRHVLVSGGAGAVGNAAIQLARWSDATVLTTVSGPEKASLARAAGADHVINYRTEDVVAQVREIVPNGVDSIVEVAASNGEIDARALAPDGSVALYAATADEQLRVPVRQLMSVNARWQFVLLYTLDEATKAGATADVTAALRAGAVRVGRAAGLPLHHYPLEHTARAHDAVEGGAVGKVLVDVFD